MKIIISGKDWSNRCGSPSRSDDVDGLSQTFKFTMAYNPNDKYFAKADINCGDKVIVQNDDGKEIFRGTITDEARSGQYKRTYTCHDNGWYLNKNEIIVQLKNISADSAIKKMCDEVGISCKVCSMPTKINQIFNGTVLSDAIKEIISKVEGDQAKSYRLEVNGDKLEITEYKDLVVKTSFKMAKNITPIDPTTIPGTDDITKSIDNMANVVKVIGAGEKSTTVADTKQDGASIAKYGTIQKVIKLTEDEKSKVKNIAANKLKELNKVTETRKVKLLGDDNVRSGRIIKMGDVLYLVSSCTHDYIPVHTMTLDLEVVQ